MFERLNKWPTPVTRNNWKDINISDIIADIDTQTEGMGLLVTTLKQIRAGLAAVESPRTFSHWEFRLSYEELVDIFALMLERIRDTASHQPEWLVEGVWRNPDGNQSAPWDPYLDHGSFYIRGDGYIITTNDRQRDMGQLYEIGRELDRLQRLGRGGHESGFTQAARTRLEYTTDEGLQSIKDSLHGARQEIAQLTKDAASQIETLKAASKWSIHYDARCRELDRKIEGGWRRLNFGFVNRYPRFRWVNRIPYFRFGLKFYRSAWFWLLLTMFAAYASAAAWIALAMMSGWPPFHNPSRAIDGILSGFGKYFLSLTLYGVLAGVYIGYANANRQLKVYQNLLEQNRHRAVVAKTIESIVASVIKTQDGSATPEERTPARAEELEKLVAVAAAAMFEYRPIGHLSSKEGTILADILNIGK